MKIKRLTLLTTLLLTANLAFSWQLPQKAEVVLKAEEKPAYIKNKMANYFDQAKKMAEEKKSPPPFVAPEGWTYSNFDLESGGKVEKLVQQNSNNSLVLVQFHGGAYILSLGNGHRDLAIKHATLIKASEIYMLDYRIAPENVYPAALNDAVKLYEHLLNQGVKPENIVFTGDSAGGNLALALALKLKEDKKPQPRFMLLQSPWATFETDTPSRRENAKTDASLGEGTPLYDAVIKPAIYAGNMDLKDPKLSPIYADLSGLPPILIQVGGAELFVDDAYLLWKKANADGVSATLTNYPLMPHDFALLLPELEDSNLSFREIQNFAQMH